MVAMSLLPDAVSELPETVFVDLLERDDAYLVIIDVPGVTADSVDIRLDRGRLAVQATRENDIPEGFEYTDERRDSSLDLEVPVPVDATDENATATIERGVLEVTLPKRADDGVTTIPVETD